jgi:hypothetical protein
MEITSADDPSPATFRLDFYILATLRCQLIVHGGLTPTTTGCVFASRRTALDFHCAGTVSHTTVG